MFRRVLALLFPLCGCEVGFVEPNPPELLSLTWQLEAKASDEPVVVGLLFDLYVQNAEECARTRQRFLDAFGNAALATGGRGRLLPTQELSPGCRPSLGRRLDVLALETAILDAEDAFRGSRIRPVLLYLNNVELPLPPLLAQDLESLRIRARDRGALVPRLWGATTPVVASSVAFDERMDWTYSSDPDLLSHLGGLVGARLPLVSREGFDQQTFPVLEGEDATRTLQLKTCAADERLRAIDFRLDGAATVVEPHRPPQVRANLPDVIAEYRDALTPELLAVQLEACRAHCDRYLDPNERGVKLRWSAVPHCLLGKEVAR